MSAHTPERPSVATVDARVERRLAAQDQRYTTGRRRLVTLLVEAERPITLPELVAMDASLSQSSVYRNLDVLERGGLVRRIATGSEHARFELSEPMLAHHHHLICVQCGDVEDIRFPEAFEHDVDRALNTIAERANFVPIRHTLDLHGHCRVCAPIS